MLRPTKYLNPDTCILNISMFILKEFRKNSLIGYNELAKQIRTKIGDNARENFPYALSFLFLLNKIIYYPEIDSFELINLSKNNEVI